MLFWISVVLAGVSLGCVLLVLFRPWVSIMTREASGSFAARMGVLWPWVQASALLCRPFITWGTRRWLARVCALAGQPADCLPEHVIGLSALAFAAAGMAGAGLYFVSGADAVWASATTSLLSGFVLAWLPIGRLKRKGKDRQLDMLRDFPFLLDMTTLCVEAGLNLQGALSQAAAHGPEGGLKYELSRALSDMRAGVPRMAALRSFAGRTGLPEVGQWVMAMEQADQLGMSLGPILRAQSEQRRNERFLRAEKLALEAPVKMLFPMVTCIFPCTFLVIAFPIVVKLMAVDF